jgi:hypothetical protein
MQKKINATECGKLATFFIWQLPYEKGSELATPCIIKIQHTSNYFFENM